MPQIYKKIRDQPKLISILYYLHSESLNTSQHLGLFERGISRRAQCEKAEFTKRK